MPKRFPGPGRRLQRALLNTEQGPTPPWPTRSSPSDPSAAIDGIWAASAWLTRVNVHGADGGGRTLDFAHRDNQPLTGIYMVGNRFGGHSFHGCPILISTKASLAQNRGNVWDDTGKAIPKPQQHD